MPEPDQETTDLELVRRSRTGDAQAFGQLVTRHQTLVCSVALAQCGDLPLSEDIAQESFVQAWKKLSSLQEDARFKAWLCTIVRNVAKRRGKRWNRPAHGGAAPLEKAPEPAARSLDPAGQMSLAEDVQILMDELEGLPELYREPLILYYRQHQSVSEVADDLELSTDAVKQRLKRGRDLLRGRVIATLGSTLFSSRPGTVFTATVLAAITGVPPKAAAAGLGIGGATAATAATGLGAKFFASIPVYGLLLVVGAIVLKIDLANLETEEEKSACRRHSWRILLVTAISLLVWFGGYRVLGPILRPMLHSGLTIVFALSSFLIMFPLHWWWRRESRRYAGELASLQKNKSAQPPRELVPLSSKSRALIYSGTALAVAVPYIILCLVTNQPWVLLVSGLMVTGAGLYGMRTKATRGEDKTYRRMGFVLIAIVLVLGIPLSETASTNDFDGHCLLAALLLYTLADSLTKYWINQRAVAKSAPHD